MGISESQVPGTQLIGRATALLRLVAEHHWEGITLADLVRQSGLERPTAHRIISALIHEGLVQRASKSRKYYLGSFCSELSSMLADERGVRGVCQPVLDRVSRNTGNSSFLIIKLGYEAFCLSRSIGSYPIQVLGVKVAHRQPLGVGAGGLAILSALDDAERTAVYKANADRYAQYGALTLATLKAHVSATQKRGYSVVGHYSVPGVIGVGITLRNELGDPIGAITTASVEHRMQRDKQQEAAHLLSKEIGLIQDQLSRLGQLLGGDKTI